MGSLRTMTFAECVFPHVQPNTVMASFRVSSFSVSQEAIRYVPFQMGKPRHRWTDVDREPARSLEASSARQSFHQADRGDLGRLGLTLWKICSKRLWGVGFWAEPSPESQGAAGAVKVDSDGRARSAPARGERPALPSISLARGRARGVAS